MPKPTDKEADYMCFSPLRRKTSKLEGEEDILVGLFPGIYVIGDKINRQRLTIEFGCRIPRKSSEEIICFLHCLLFSSSFLTFYKLFPLFFTVF
jgi:hypothetical protein